MVLLCVHKSNFSFSIKNAGIICQRCIPKDPSVLRVSDKTIKLLRLFYYFDLSRLGNISVSEETKKEIAKVMDL